MSTEYTRIRNSKEICSDCGFEEAIYIAIEESEDNYTERLICLDCKYIAEGYREEVSL